MSVKQAIILAAGMGTRLKPLTDDKPKCLVEVNGISILEKTLNNLKKIGVKKVTIITGYLYNKIQDKLNNEFNGMFIDYIYNKDFKTTNSMYSLYLGLKNIKQPTLVLESDIFFEENIIKNNKLGDIIWYVDSSIKNVDGSYVKVSKDNKVIEHNIKRDLSEIDTEDAKSLGILSLNEYGVKVMKQWLLTAIHEEKQNLYYDLILGEHIGSNLIEAIDVKGSNWFEIDSLEDLWVAKERFI